MGSTNIMHLEFDMKHALLPIGNFSYTVRISGPSDMSIVEYVKQSRRLPQDRKTTENIHE